MSEESGNLNSTNDSCFKLPSVLDINYAPEFYDHLKEFLHLDSEICLEASSVSRITTPCVQIIISFFEELKSNGKNLKIINPSDDFCRIMADLGLGQHELTTKYIAG